MASAPCGWEGRPVWWAQVPASLTPDPPPAHPEPPALVSSQILVTSTSENPELVSAVIPGSSVTVEVCRLGECLKKLTCCQPTPFLQQVERPRVFARLHWWRVVLRAGATLCSVLSWWACGASSGRGGALCPSPPPQLRALVLPVASGGGGDQLWPLGLLCNRRPGLLQAASLQACPCPSALG